jgi:TRAP-type C4-dicarboxylate transport system permease small subunit
MISAAKAVGRAMTAVSIALMVLLCIPITYEAIARAFGAPTIWVFETTLYAFVFLGFLGNALAVQSGAHFRVTLLIDVFPQSGRIFDAIAHLSTLAFAMLIMATGSYFVWYSWSNGILSATLLEVPLWLPQLAIPLGGLGLFLQTLVTMADGAGESAEQVIGD